MKANNSADITNWFTYLTARMPGSIPWILHTLNTDRHVLPYIFRRKCPYHSAAGTPDQQPKQTLKMPDFRGLDLCFPLEFLPFVVTPNCNLAKLTGNDIEGYFDMAVKIPRTGDKLPTVLENFRLQPSLIVKHKTVWTVVFQFDRPVSSREFSIDQYLASRDKLADELGGSAVGLWESLESTENEIVLNSGVRYQYQQFRIPDPVLLALVALAKRGSLPDADAVYTHRCPSKALMLWMRTSIHDWPSNRIVVYPSKFKDSAVQNAGIPPRAGFIRSPR